MDSGLPQLPAPGKHGPLKFPSLDTNDIVWTRNIPCIMHTFLQSLKETDTVIANTTILGFHVMKIIKFS